MLKLPSFRYFAEQGVTAYQHDTKWWQFTLIPDYVSLRRDINGNPVFLLVKYAFSDQDREEHKDLPHGGGYLVLDAELSVKKEHETAIVAQLQRDVDAIYRELKAVADRGGKPVKGARLTSAHHLHPNNAPGIDSTISIGVDDVLLGLSEDDPASPPGDKPPAVILSSPLWSEGTFRITAPQSTALVANRVAEGKASLTGNNVVSASMDLTDAGATFMEKTLLTPAGAGASDLTPIQIEYELKFEARMPPTTVNVEADSRSLFLATQAISHDYEGRGCDEDVITHSDQQLSMAVDSGLIKVRIDAGMLDLGDDFLQQIRSDALKQVQDTIKERFLEKRPAPPADEKTKDFVDRESDVYYMKSTFDQSSMHVGYSERIEGLKPWPANPQGTLQSFFAGMSADEMKKFVRVVDLDDDFFKSLKLTANAYARWETDEVQFIECQVHYTGTDENGHQVDKDESFTFTKEHVTDSWDPSLIGNKREYSYRHRVAHTGRETGPWTSWVKQSGPVIDINVAEAGRAKAAVIAGNLDFQNVIASAQVEVRYADPVNHVAEIGETFIFNAGQASASFNHLIYTPRTKPLRYRAFFVLKTGQTVQGDWQETHDDQIIVNQPGSVHTLDAHIVPAGDWSNVQQAIVDLRYADGPDWTVQYSLRLADINAFGAWRVVLKDPAKRSWDYRTLVTYKDGNPPTETEWTATSNETIALTVAGATTKRDVQILPSMVDFTTTPVVEVVMRYDDAAGHIHQVESFPFTSAATPAVWKLPLKNASMTQYRYQVTYHRPDGPPVAVPERVNEGQTIVIERLKVPQVACTIGARFVDFVQTPVVEAHLSYDDPSNGLAEETTLTFTEAAPQTWKLGVRDGAPRDYHVVLTYYRADGSTFVRDAGELTSPMLQLQSLAALERPQPVA